MKELYERRKEKECRRGKTDREESRGRRGGSAEGDVEKRVPEKRKVEGKSYTRREKRKNAGGCKRQRRRGDEEDRMEERHAKMRWKRDIQR